ncbi:hypothetical protein Hdeb2414_s0014g00422801 [Helianthus debilis subsp. tardiflorus]
MPKIRRKAEHVLCHLFKKSEENIDALKYDDAEPASLSPTAQKSSPDDASLHNVSMDGTEMWLTDTAHNLAHSSADSFENQVSDPLKSSEKEPVEKDGTCEQDVCLSELLSLLQNGKECSINKSASKITTTMGSETPVSTGISVHIIARVMIWNSQQARQIFMLLAVLQLVNPNSSFGPVTPVHFELTELTQAQKMLWGKALLLEDSACRSILHLMVKKPVQLSLRFVTALTTLR